MVFAHSAGTSSLAKVGTLSHDERSLEEPPLWSTGPFTPKPSSVLRPRCFLRCGLRYTLLPVTDVTCTVYVLSRPNEGANSLLSNRITIIVYNTIKIKITKLSNEWQQEKTNFSCIMCKMRSKRVLKSL